MGWTLSRLSRVVTLSTMGTGVGFVAGYLMKSPVMGAMGGGLIALSWHVVSDTRRASRLLRWLRSDQRQSPPRDPGLWGELAYYTEKLYRRQEASLRAERERLAQFLSAIEASPNGVLLVDENEQIAWCNLAAADHYGIDPQRDLQQRVTNLIRHPEFVRQYQLAEGGHAEGGQTFLVPRGQDGGTLQLVIRPYGSGSHLILSQDITERERAESMRRDFVANVSHEMRTPLTVLSGFIETMAHLPLSETERGRVLELMVQQTQRMQSLISDLLTLASLEGSPRPATDQWHEVEPMWLGLETEAHGLSSGRHRLRFDGVTRVSLAGVRTELVSAMSNLVSNAIRYTPEGGEIVVRLSLGADGRLTFSVQDTGPGIARDHLPRLTERFYRVDGSRSRETGGTGLGLSIVKHVVQRHGGQLDIQSELGQGSTFRIDWPAGRVRLLRSGPDLPA